MSRRPGCLCRPQPSGRPSAGYRPSSTQLDGEAAACDAPAAHKQEVASGYLKQGSGSPICGRGRSDSRCLRVETDSNLDPEAPTRSVHPGKRLCEVASGILCSAHWSISAGGLRRLEALWLDVPGGVWNRSFVTGRNAMCDRSAVASRRVVTGRMLRIDYWALAVAVTADCGSRAWLSP